MERDREKYEHIYSQETNQTASSRGELSWGAGKTSAMRENERRSLNTIAHALAYCFILLSLLTRPRRTCEDPCQWAGRYAWTMCFVEHCYEKTEEGETEKRERERERGEHKKV